MKKTLYNEATIMPFGAHKGVPLGKVPRYYLRAYWVVNQHRAQEAGDRLTSAPFYEVLQYIQSRGINKQTRIR